MVTVEVSRFLIPSLLLLYEQYFIITQGYLIFHCFIIYDYMYYNIIINNINNTIVVTE